MEMKTLTVNGQSFQVTDGNAMGKNAACDLNMNGHDILNIGTAVADKVELPGGSQSEFVGIRSECSGHEDRPALVLYGYGEGQEPVLRGIGNGVEDQDAATVGQVNAAIAEAIGKLPNLDEVMY